MFVGVDVSKARLDVSIRPSGESFSVNNDDEGIVDLVNRLKANGQIECIVAEATGRYEAMLATACSLAKLPIVVVNPRQVRDFAKATGRLAKTDRIDAAVLAHFGEAIRPEVKPLLDEQSRQLEALVVRRKQLVEMRTAERNRRHIAPRKVVVLIDEVITLLTKQVRALEKDIDDEIKKTPAWREREELFASVGGIGPTTTARLIVSLPELGKLTGKQIAAVVGVAPMNNDSGKRAGTRSCWGGRANVRQDIYMATLTAIRRNDAIKEFYERLIQAKKPKKLALIACMRKLLVILNAMDRDKKTWATPPAAA